MFVAIVGPQSVPDDIPPAADAPTAAEAVPLDVCAALLEASPGNCSGAWGFVAAGALIEPDAPGRPVAAVLVPAFSVDPDAGAGSVDVTGTFN